MTRKQCARIRYLRAKRSYSTKELAQVLRVHPRTVQEWHKYGLQSIAEKCFPLLFIGRTVKDFLNARRSKRKCKLAPDECFCPRCRRPRLSKMQPFKIEPTGRHLGSGQELVLLRGICIVCDCPMVKFGVGGDPVLSNSTSTPTGPQGRLWWPSAHTVNTDSERICHEYSIQE